MPNTYSETIEQLILTRKRHLHLTKMLVAQDMSIQDIDKERVFGIIEDAIAYAATAIVDQALTEPQAAQALSDLTILNLRLEGHLRNPLSR